MQLRKRCTSVVNHILVANCTFIRVVKTPHSLIFLFPYGLRIAVSSCFICCRILAITFLFFGIRVVIVYDASIRLLSAFIVNLSHFGISIFLLLITRVYNIAAP
jgi:hypothetical protein